MYKDLFCSFSAAMAAVAISIYVFAWPASNLVTLVFLIAFLGGVIGTFGSLYFVYLQRRGRTGIIGSYVIPFLAVLLSMIIMEKTYGIVNLIGEIERISITFLSLISGKI